jgi:threonyl-tRNA synthetase
LGKQKTNRILIYPFAHLSGTLSNPGEALKIIKAMETYAKEKGIETYRAPFGWNKQFTVSIKGHPLAETARTYTAAEVKAMIHRFSEKTSSSTYIAAKMMSARTMVFIPIPLHKKQIQRRCACFFTKKGPCAARLT